jgi:glycosyltransferase involved in cell wall biosynthesis
MRHADFIRQYDVPVVDPSAPRPQLRWARRGEGRVRSIVGRLRERIAGPRLAYIDSHFPWQRSGFRYADALALHEARRDTVFFSMYATRDPFPAKVFPLAQLPRLARSLGVTDIYGVFQNFMSGVLGLRPDRDVEENSVQGLDLSRVLRHYGIRAHAGLYPGGGFVATKAGFVDAVHLVEAADTVVSWSLAVLQHVPGVHPIDPAIIDCAFYRPVPHDFAVRPLQLLFVADAKPRKGLPVALDALRVLEGEPVHLHVVGPDNPAWWDGPPERVTFHGWLGRAELRTLHARCQVVISPVSGELPDDPGGDGGVTDGFPTAAAGEAMSSGCLLITANPDADHRVLAPGVDHIETTATETALADAVRRVLADAGAAAAIAESGSRRVRERLDVRVGVRARLAIMGLDPASASLLGPRAIQRRARRPPEPAIGLPASADVRPMTSELRALRSDLDSLRSEMRLLRAEQAQTASENEARIAAVRDQLLAVGELALDDEAQTRRLLYAARASAEYDSAFDDPAPMVSICIPTYTNHQGLVERAIPSALAQYHDRIEVVVVGDASTPETAAALRAFDDPRIRYENMGMRGPYPEDPHLRWLVAGTGPLNRSIELAEGDWVAILNDDDALRPDHATMLLELARAERAEVAYGKYAAHAPDGSVLIIGAFPPAHTRFNWQCAIHHRTIARLFQYELAAALFNEPGDWHRARRMLRAGVRFSMIDAVVFDCYPSMWWRER